MIERVGIRLFKLNGNRRAKKLTFIKERDLTGKRIITDSENLNDFKIESD